MIVEKKPLISIVTVCYNSEETIENTIKSVLAQTYDNYEYLIIDGCSKDNTLSIVDKYKGEFGDKLRVYSEEDTGIYNAMNKGVAKSKGVLVALLNSDDTYAQNTLELVAKKYEEEKTQLIIINGDMVRISEANDEIFRYRFTQKNIEKKECFGHPTMFAAKKVYEKIGLYDETYKLAADGEWQYRAHEDGEIKFVLVNEVFTYMREGGASDLFKYRWKWFKERVRMKKAYRKTGILSIYMQELKSVIRTDIKNILPKKLHSIAYKVLYKN